MQRSDDPTFGKPAGDAGRPTASTRHALFAAGLVGPAAWLLAGCGSGADLMSTVALPSETAGASQGQPASTGNDPESASLDVTPTQREFLDALSAAGVHPASELGALSIGSSVCQAHAAGQSDQAVWDYIAPMVRSDVATAHPTTGQPVSAAEVDAATADYIRIAGQRLC